MNLRGLEPGDRVECNVKGRVFPAAYQGVEGPRVMVEPESTRITYRLVKKTEIVRRLEVTS